MKQTDWKIIYSSYEGVVKRAIQLLSREAGGLIIREPDVYSIYTLPVEKEGCEISKNAFFVGLYADSPTIRRFVKEDELPEDGFIVRITENPNDPEGRFVILSAHNEKELYYAVVSFLDDYIPGYAPNHNPNYMPDLIFDSPLGIYSYTERPSFETRSVFTWGHSFNDYRAYIENMARMKLNEVIIWNDYLPLNIDDIIEYAHSFGIRVILGYSWGWREISNKAEIITDEELAELRKKILSQYVNVYAKTNCDGIYFQSFTERKDEIVNGKPIARIVTEFVNETSDALFKLKPDLRLQFGLHATSVKSWLSEIANVDPRIEILWEDCGAFPFSYISAMPEENAFRETLDFVEKLLSLRDGAGVGLVFKSVMMLDWGRFAMQRGPYIMGDNSKRIAEHDRRIRANSWRRYSADWFVGGHKAHELLTFIKEHSNGKVNICLAGTFDGGIYLPEALCAQMTRRLYEDFPTTLRRVTRRPSLTVD